MTNSLSKEKASECKKIFDLFDSDKDSYVTVDKLDQICKGLGAYIPTDDMQDFIKEASEGKVSYEHFLKFFTEFYNKKMDKKQLIEAFTFLDSDKKGFISASELKHALTVIGDCLTDDEADELLSQFIDKNGNIDYKKFANEISK
jgi:Ca2+-binding EF-hand superfamily protein